LSTILLTGMGTVGAYGCGADSLRRALASPDPESLLSAVDTAAGFHRRGGARRALLAKGISLAEWLAPGEARRMSPPSKLAVAAARMALVCAGFPDRRADREDTSVVISTAFGPTSYSEALVRQILFEGPEATSPFLFTESVANAPAAQIAILCRARGPSVTVCQREAGALQAVGNGAADVASGRASRALAGAVEEMTPLLHALLDRFGALDVLNGGVARPFDRRRAGFMASEGATVVLLETAESAAERGARALARVLAWGSAFDPTAPQTGWGTGHERLARSLRRGLERAGLDLGDIDRIVSGASGARDGDRLEALMLRAAWSAGGKSRPLPPILAPKSLVGEYGGGFLGAAVLAASGACCGAGDGGFELDPELGIVPDHRTDRSDPSDLSSASPRPATVLVTSLAAGGAASWLVLGAPS
jgi:3-oxoacyl-[acyl-carrier-protein] synthase II